MDAKNVNFIYRKTDYALSICALVYTAVNRSNKKRRLKASDKDD